MYDLKGLFFFCTFNESTSNVPVHYPETTESSTPKAHDERPLSYNQTDNFKLAAVS